MKNKNIKICVVGEGGTGNKSACVIQYIQNNFVESTRFFF